MQILDNAKASGSEPSVSIILLNWNNSDDTIRCLASLAVQSYRNWAAVVVDNGSSDGSVVRLRREFPSIVLIENGSNLGFARGCNVGIAFALNQGAEYIWLLNNDTAVEVGALAAMVATAEADRSIGGVGALLCNMGEPSRVHEWGGGWLHLGSGVAGVYRKRPRRGAPDYICGGCLLVRRSALQQVGLLDPGYFMYGEDAELGVRLRGAGWRLAVASDARVRHRLGPSMPQLARVFYSSAALARTLRKHGSWPLAGVLCGTMYRCARNLAVGRWRLIAAQAQGAVAGWRAYGSDTPYALPLRYQRCGRRVRSER